MEKIRRKIGAIDEIVVAALNLSMEPNTAIYISDTNIEHMKKEHPEDFLKYGGKISEILSNPDYIASHPNNGSIQYIKVYYDDEKEKKVLVAIRSTRKGIWYARSLFVMSEQKVQSYERKGFFKEYKKKNKKKPVA